MKNASKNPESKPMTDKNEFRYIQKGDLIKVRPKTESEKVWYRDFIDTVRNELNSMLELIR